MAWFLSAVGAVSCVFLSICFVGLLYSADHKSAALLAVVFAVLAYKAWRWLMADTGRVAVDAPLADRGTPPEAAAATQERHEEYPEAGALSSLDD